MSNVNKCIPTLVQVVGLFASAEAMNDDADFRALLLAWIKTAKMDNMHVERLLSLIKKSGMEPLAAPMAERLCSTGFLAQWQKEHRSALGKDAGLSLRKNLIGDGAPLVAGHRQQKRKRTPNNACGGGFLAFRKLKIAERHAGMTREACHEWERQLASDWRDLPLERKQEFRTRARADLQARDTLPDPAQVEAHKLKGMLFGLASSESPLSVEAFRAAVCSQLGWPQGGDLGGFTKYMETMREHFLKDLLVRDAGQQIRAHRM